MGARLPRLGVAGAGGRAPGQRARAGWGTDTGRTANRLIGAGRFYPSSVMTPAELRALVPATRERTYLDTATYGPAAEPTADAVRAFADQWSRGSTRFETWDGYVDECRARL